MKSDKDRIAELEAQVKELKRTLEELIGRPLTPLDWQRMYRHPQQIEGNPLPRLPVKWEQAHGVDHEGEFTIWRPVR